MSPLLYNNVNTKVKWVTCSPSVGDGGLIWSMLPAAGGSQPCPQVEAERPKGLNITVSSWQRYEATTLHQTQLKKSSNLTLKTKVWLAFVLPRCCQQLSSVFFLNVSLWREGRGFGKGRGFRGRMRVGLRHCNERKTSSLLVLLSYGCMYGVGRGFYWGKVGGAYIDTHQSAQTELSWEQCSKTLCGFFSKQKSLFAVKRRIFVQK